MAETPGDFNPTQPDPLFASRDLLTQMAVARMPASLSTRRYPVGLEPVGSEVEATATRPRRAR